MNWAQFIFLVSLVALVLLILVAGFPNCLWVLGGVVCVWGMWLSTLFLYTEETKP